MGVPYAEQLARKTAATREALSRAAGGAASGAVWEEPATSPEQGFRNKAKMVVAGTVEEPTLGILDPRGDGIDLRHCGLHEPGLHAALPVLADHVRQAGLTPYDVPGRRGELKHLVVTVSPDGRLMVRWVLRSTEALPRLRKHLPALLDALPVAVASANLQAEHKAVLEGPEEVLLTGPGQETLPMRLEVPGAEAVVLQLRPQSFFQTNTLVATELYATARRWVATLAPASVWDLYSGVGGFALHLADDARAVTGVEISEEAVRGAQRAARLAGLRADFVAGDAVAWAPSQPRRPELLVVNPPRRGLGDGLSGWVESSGVPHVLYSSCHSGSLARDLAAMPSYAVERVRLLDMFPQTTHHEVLVLLRRR